MDSMPWFCMKVTMRRMGNARMAATGADQIAEVMGIRYRSTKTWL